jgi:hypothetical protein
MGAVAHYIRRNFQPTPWRLRKSTDHANIALAVGICLKTLDIVDTSRHIGFDLAFTAFSAGISFMTFGSTDHGLAETDRSMDGAIYVNRSNPEAPSASRIGRDTFCCGARIIRFSNWELYVFGSGSALLSSLASLYPPAAAVIMMKSSNLVCLKLKDDSMFPGEMHLGRIWDA